MDYLTTIKYAEIGTSFSKLIKLLNEFKIVVIKDYTLAFDPLVYLNSLADGLGDVFNMDENINTGQATGNRWIDVTYDPEILNRYRTAPVAQPLHTDFSYYNLPGNIQMLFCKSQAEFGGATTFLDTKLLVKLLDFSKEESLLRDLTTIDVTFSKDSRSRTSPILQQSESDWLINWNYYCASKSNSEESLALIERFHEYLERRVVKSGLVTEVELNINDMVLFHDERVLHGRNSYFASEKGMRSLFERYCVSFIRFQKLRIEIINN